MKQLLFIALAVVGLYGCNQDQQAVSPDSDSEVAATSTARLASDSSGFFCRDSITRIEVSALPTAVSSYISANYTGATIEYAAQDDNGNYLVSITQNGERKALLFNADGSFNEELAFRNRKGRNGGGKGQRSKLEEIAVTELPSAITSYISTNYAGAEIKTAAQDSTRGYLVMITVDDQNKTLLFNTDGSFNKEVSKPLKGRFTSVAVADLPASVTSYVTTNYAGSTIKQAVQEEDGDLIVWVKTSDSKYVALLFASDGTFKQVLKQRG
ncbi:PepSY-like domain-containing protein [Larkinella sp. VNQ87]|uniref:PepSY-like domain-containing protein n=1 Tax=Larkinella sp. VNQ87 TaxID=3400921 RepID=UPI003C067037